MVFCLEISAENFEKLDRKNVCVLKKSPSSIKKLTRLDKMPMKIEDSKWKMIDIEKDELF